MIRSILRTFSRFLAAVLLFGLVLCAVEVWFHWNRLEHSLEQNSIASGFDDLVKPSKTMYLEVAPLLETEMFQKQSGTVVLKTNEFGLRGENVTVPKPPTVFRVLCLGGASVFGLGISEEETLTGNLKRLFDENDLKHVEFINAGCPGSGPLASCLRLRQQLLSLQPDLVIFCLRPEDLSLDTEVRGGLTLDEHGYPAFATHPTLAGTSSSELDSICKEFATVSWIVNSAGPILGVTGKRAILEPNENPGANALSPFLAMWHFTNSINARLMISIIPNAWDLQPSSGQTGTQNVAAFDRDLQTLFADRGIHSVTMIHNSISQFKEANETSEFFHEQDGALTQVGYSMYARSLAKSIVNHVPTILTQPVPPSLPAPEETADTIRSNNINSSRTAPPGLHTQQPPGALPIVR